MFSKTKLHFLPSLIILICITLSCEQRVGEEEAAKEEWIQLYNGKDMANWTPKISGFKAGDNYKNTFRIEEGYLSSSYSEYDTFRNEFGHLFYSKDKFSHYRLRAKYRFVGEQVKGGPGWAYRNNGLMLHSQAVETMGVHQDFPNSLEMQLLAGRGQGKGERSTGNLCTPGTNVYMMDTLFTPHCINSTSKTYHDEMWVNVEALVLGDSIVHHIVEGSTVLTFTKPVLDDGTPITEGYITIQAESHPTQFERIELLNLCGCKDPKAKNYKSYYVKDDRSKCVY
ncbi:MAG: hypothetical protein ACJA2S_001488 [Cyclobacteriaceae bacterium]|jgi:hypothetical protein